MRLGNLQFNQMREFLGYELTDEDYKIWKKYHNNNANLEGKDECFHIYLMPTCIVVKGKEALEAVKKIFSPEKCVEAKGEFSVYIQGA